LADPAYTVTTSVFANVSPSVNAIESFDGTNVSNAMECELLIAAFATLIAALKAMFAVLLLHMFNVDTTA
jgi:hypothetical protein